MTDERRGDPVVVGDLVVEPIERVTLWVQSGRLGAVGFAFKEPVAVVFRTPERSWRIDLVGAADPIVDNGA